MSGDKIVSLKPKPYRRAFTNSSDFLFFDQTCSAQEPWEIQGRWLLSSVNPDTGSALVASMTGNQEAKLVDLNSRTMGAPIGAGDSDLGGMPLFANEGKSACKPGGLEGNRYSQAVCFDIASGKLLGKAPVNGGGPMATAAHSSRVVLTDWRYQPYIIMDGGFEILRKRIVWDFETKEEIVSWGSGNQRYYQWHAREENTWGKKPFAVAFSADGTLVAEGGDGLIRLYRIQPAQSR